MKSHTLFSAAVVIGSAALLGVTSCAAPLNAGSSSSSGEGASQVVERESAEKCTNASPSKKAANEMTIGFAQSENEQNPFRAVETASVKAAIEKSGAKYVYTNAGGDQAKQLTDVQSMINQGVDALIVAPIGATGLQSAFADARAKGIPVVTIDRKTSGTACTDYLTFMGSDFYEQGVRAAKAVVEATGGSGSIAEVQGAPGSDVAVERTKGFQDEIAKNPGLKIVAQQTGNWETSKAQEVVGQMISANPDVNAIYTHADVMAEGAITALRNFGKNPGQDVKIVSIDGLKSAVSGVANGTVAAVVETNPRFGPAAVKAILDWTAGTDVSQEVIMKDALYTKDNAQAAVDSGAAY